MPRKKFFRLTTEQQAILIQSSNFLLNSPRLYQNPHPELSGLKGPADNFGNMSFMEFMHADTYFNAFRRNKRPEALTSFLAAMYRSDRDFNAEDWQSSKVMERSRKLRKVPNMHKQSLVVWFSSCKRQLSSRNPNVFSGGNQEESNKKPTSPNWHNILFEVAGPKMGDIHQVAKQNIHTVFAYLDREIKDAKRKAKELEKIRSKSR
ncbi:hypothetical protein V6R21_07755 [Limibacter armeniacum]|uniref:hypothetical protein n=1 Tax=Limibacter armeniacum TaxID=466084 RepID=UPI002FE659D6